MAEADVRQQSEFLFAPPRLSFSNSHFMPFPTVYRCLLFLFLPAFPLAVLAQSDFAQQVAEADTYLTNRDLDGDDRADQIQFTYSGGGHCCYTMHLQLSSERKVRKYPFEMDGGYVFGVVDGSQPAHFRIEDFDRDGRAEIMMEISTYNGEQFPIEKKWTKKYGFSSNRIVFDFKDGEMQIRDFEDRK